MADLFKRPQDKLPVPFDVRYIAPFMARALNNRERTLVFLFRDFYFDNIARSSEPVSSFSDDYYAYARSQGYTTSELLTHGGRAPTMFVGVFADGDYANTWRSIWRVYGHDVRPSIELLKKAFRDVVKYHLEETDGKALPARKDFERYHDEELYLLETGIFVPSLSRFGKILDKHSTVLAELYQACFQPGELDKDLLRIALGTEPTLDELVENYQKCYSWMHATRPHLKENIVPSDVDLDMFAQQENGWPWVEYEKFFVKHNAQEGLPEEDKLGIKEIREMAGFETHRKQGFRSVPNTPLTATEMKRGFIALWKMLRPDDYQPGKGILRNPPTRTEMARAVDQQGEIITAEGELSPRLCRRYEVPEVRVPRAAQIRQRYPEGLPGLLRDILNSALPETSIELPGDQAGALSKSLAKNPVPAERTPIFHKMPLVR